MRTSGWIRWIVVALLSLGVGVAFAQDVKGGRDHPLLRRVPGTVLVGYSQNAHASLEFQTSTFADFDIESGKRRYTGPALVLDGGVTRMWYEAPGAATASQLYERHMQALSAQGFNTLYDSATDKAAAPDKWVNFLATFAAGKRDDIPNNRSSKIFSSARTASLRTGTFQKDNTTVRLIAVDWPKAEEAVQARQGAYISIDVVEARSLRSATAAPGTAPQAPAPVQPQALPPVSGPAAWESALERGGRAPLTGIRFGSGDAQLDADSKATIVQLARYLKTHADMKLFIVGHTDATGDLRGNLELSRARAEAVLDALEEAGGVPRERLSAHGVGPLAPIADNGSSAGRAKNRRIELVRRP